MPGPNEVHRSQKVAAEISGHSECNILISIEEKKSYRNEDTVCLYLEIRLWTNHLCNADSTMCKSSSQSNALDHLY